MHDKYFHMSAIKRRKDFFRRQQHDTLQEIGCSLKYR